MSKAILIAAALVGLAVAGPADARSPLEGRWDRKDMQIEIKPCGASLCGTVVSASAKQKARAQNGSDTNLVGATLIRQIQPTGRQTYRARVFLPDRNMNASQDHPADARSVTRVGLRAGSDLPDHPLGPGALVRIKQRSRSDLTWVKAHALIPHL